MNHKLWSAKSLLEDPKIIQDIHYDYYKAGADVCTTATYQASVQGFLEEGIVIGEVNQLFVKAVELCSGARDRFWEEYSMEENENPSSNSSQEEYVKRQKPLVAYSCGAYGACKADGSGV